MKIETPKVREIFEKSVIILPSVMPKSMKIKQKYPKSMKINEYQKIGDKKIVGTSELRSETLGISDLEGSYIFKFPT